MNCPKCGTNNVPEAAFCASCGSLLTAAPPADSQPAAEAPAAQPAYTPPVTEAPAAPYTPEPAYSAPQQPYQPQAYQPQPSYQPQTTYTSAPSSYGVTGDSSKNWAAITSMICGIVSILCCVFVVPGILCGAAAVIFGILGLKSQKKGMAIAGLITGIIGLILFLFVLFSVIASGGLEYYLYDIYYEYSY